MCPSVLARIPHATLTAVVFLGLTFGLLGGAQPAQTAQTAAAYAHPPTATTHTVAALANTSKKCATKARKQAKKNKKYKYWVCVGNGVKYLKKKRPTSSAAAQDGAPAGREATKPAAKLQLGVDSQDSMCELVPECANIKTLYRADIKGNAFYGYGDEIWGTFDVIYTQYFNGASSNYNLKLIWDSGYAIDSNYWTAQVRREIKGVPDPVTGSVYFYPNRIASNAWTAVEPGRGKFSPTRPTRFTGRHHDDLYGSFVAHGQVFGTTTIHLPDFRCPRHLCKYYGPTGPV